MSHIRLSGTVLGFTLVIFLEYNSSKNTPTYGGHWATLVDQTVKNLPIMQEIWVRSLGQEDPLEEGMVTHSSTLAWETPWMEEPDGLQSLGSHRVGRD